MSTFPSLCADIRDHGVDPATFRRAMAVVPTGVAVITTLGAGGEYVGLTVNSLASLSLTPPLITWALKVDSQSLADFQHRQAFVVNLLAVGQEDLSRRFASPSTDRFSDIDVVLTSCGLPRLAGCAVTLECEMHSNFRVGDHMLLIGVVQDAEVNAGPALGYCAGRYFQPAVSLDGDCASSRAP